MVPRLLVILRDSKSESREHLHASLALLPYDDSQIDYLLRRMLTADAIVFPIIRDALIRNSAKIVNSLWAICEDSRKDQDQQFRAACALATYDPEDSRWVNIVNPLANRLLREDLTIVRSWIVALRPVRGKLSVPILAIFKDAGRSDADRSLAAIVLAHHFADDPVLLTKLLLDATERQFVYLIVPLMSHTDSATSFLSAQLETEGEGKSHDERETVAKRTANAAVGLLHLGQADRIWPLMRNGPDPTVRSHLIRRIASTEVNPHLLFTRLREDQEVSVRRALLLALGDYESDRFTPNERSPLLEYITHLYSHDLDPGIHGAAEWVLRRWDQSKALVELDRQLAMQKEESGRDWCVNGEASDDHHPRPLGVSNGIASE